MKMIVPIYLADVLFAKYETKGRLRKKVDTIEKKGMIVKGFTISDCIKRKGDRLIRELGGKGDYEVENIRFTSQHSWGVNE